MYTWVDWQDWVLWLFLVIGFWVVLLGVLVYIGGRLEHRPPTKPRTS